MSSKEGLLTAAVTEVGAPDNIDAEALATLIIALFDGLLVRWQLDPDDPPNPERLTEAAQNALATLATLGTRAGAA